MSFICGPYYCSASLDCCPQVCHPYYGYPQGGCNYPQPYCHGNGAGCNNNNNYGGYTGNQYQGCSWNQGYEAHPAYGYEGNHCSSQYYQPGPVQSVYDPHTAYCNNGAYPAYQAPYYSNAPYSAPYASEAYSAAYTNAPYSAAYTNAPYSAAYTNAPYSTGYTNVPYSTAYTNAPYSSAYTTAPYSAAYTSAPYSTVYGSSYETVYQTPAPAPAPAPAPTVSYQTGCTCPTYKDSALACGSSVDDGSSAAYDASQAYEDIASDTQQQYSTDEYSSSTELAYSDNAKERKK
ncbi:hypothetical protein IW150_001087 [Coemansia sp. RSA 2607]|nr:hypothetical protein IW150_001087 [Coemansia sp. RSA 2607]